MAVKCELVLKLQFGCMFGNVDGGVVVFAVLIKLVSYCVIVF